MIQGVHAKFNPGLPCTNSIQQEKDAIHQSIGLKIRKKRERLYLEHSFAGC
jgi:hypothetical protein